jgi:chromosome segregation ATPase
MEPALIIAIISLLGMIVNSIFNFKKNDASARRDLAEAKNIEYGTAIDLVNQLKIQVEEQSKKIDELKEKVEHLEQMEGKYLAEKRKLEAKVIELTSENEKLKARILSNKVNYTEQINKLQEELDLLEEKINKK